MCCLGAQRSFEHSPVHIFFLPPLFLSVSFSLNCRDVARAGKRRKKKVRGCAMAHVDTAALLLVERVYIQKCEYVDFFYL